MQEFALGTAAWKLIPVIVAAPVTSNRAVTSTTPGRAAETCGRRETFSPFFSYAVRLLWGAEQLLLALVPERALLFGRKATP